jgi:tRNA G18 (ribose-2'-O)-methylase SpoU
VRRGYFAIGIEHTKSVVNVGTLFRSAYSMGAAYIFTIGRRYKQQASDTTKTWRHIPLLHYHTFGDFYKQLPHDCRLVGVEILPEARPLPGYTHPERCVYLLGAEDHGLSKEAVTRCHDLVVLPGERCLNVSVAGSIVMYDRHAKGAA